MTKKAGHNPAPAKRESQGRLTVLQAPETESPISLANYVAAVTKEVARQDGEHLGLWMASVDRPD